MKIRFRVWDGEKMWYPSDTKEQQDQFMLGNEGSVFEYQEEQYGDGAFMREYTEEDGYTPMLSTGLKDKDGKEIWEGDIVRYKRPGETETIAEAGIASLFRMLNVEVIIDPEIQKAWAEEKVEYETLGNKYENPELLKEVA